MNQWIDRDNCESFEISNTRRVGDNLFTYNGADKDKNGTATYSFELTSQLKVEWIEYRIWIEGMDR